MGYALFAQRKVFLDGQLNDLQLQQTQRSNEQFLLATRRLGLDQQNSSQAAAQSGQLADIYERLANTSNSDQRFSIQQQINALQAQFEQENDRINRQIYELSVKEKAIEMEVKHLDTEVTAVQKQLEAVEEAEGQAIDRATPKFNGVG